MRFFKSLPKKSKGFTIIELLVVIVVIGILAAIVTVSFVGAQEKAKVSAAKSELNLLSRAIYLARLNTDKKLISVTGSNCTYCFDQATYELTLDRISAASGVNLSQLKDGDPWGAKYVIDENEGEGATPCAGPDLIGLTTAGKGVNNIQIPFYSCS